MAEIIAKRKKKRFLPRGAIEKRLPCKSTITPAIKRLLCKNTITGGNSGFQKRKETALFYGKGKRKAVIVWKTPDITVKMV